MYARAGRHAAQLTGTEALRHAVAPQDPTSTPPSCWPTCVIEASLASHHAQALIPQRLAAADPRRAGVRLPPRHADLRQARRPARAVVAELLKTARIEPEPGALAEDAKRDVAACAQRRINAPLRDGAAYSDKTLGEPPSSKPPAR